MPSTIGGAIEVVLVSSRNPLNIGAAARAMANFGVEHLAVVTPFDPSWRQARSAIEAEDLLVHAREASSLAEALTDCTFVAGTGTSRYRRPDQPLLMLPEFAPRGLLELAQGGRLALVFGSEKHGLTRQELSLCDVIVEIPTHPRQPSMNLGQAVAVCLYELTRQCALGPLAATPQTIRTQIHSVGEAQTTEVGPSESGTGKSRPDEPRTTAGDMNRAADLILETMQAVNYSPASMRAANEQDIRLLLHRSSLSGRDLRRTLGLFRRILWKLRH